MAKALLTTLFLFIWLLLAAAMLGKADLFPQLTQNPELWTHFGSLRVNMMYLFWFLLAVLFYFWVNTNPAYVVSPQERWRNDEYFRQKVGDLEIDYKNKPKALRTRTVLLALLGYSVVWGSIAAMAAIGVGLGLTAAALLPKIGNAAAVGLIPIGFAFKLSKALLAARGGDSGVRMSAKDAPALFALLGKIRKKGKGPAFERVFINMEMNASVSRHTGLKGFFGFGPVTLTLGLPLMQALTGPQLAAVIGHEYGHVAAKDNALGQWIYRIRNGWLYLDESMKTEYLWYVLRLDRFYHWFMGIFNAYSFTLSRQCEYEADAFAAKIAGAQKISAALVAMEVRSELMKKNFWNEIWKKSELLPEPAGTPYQRLSDFFRLPEEDKISLAELKKATTGHDSTHPALADRIAALHETLHAPEPLTLSAAGKFLGERLEMQLAALFDRAWREHNRAAWKAKHKEYQSALATLEALKNRRPSGMARDELSQLIAAAQILQDDKKILGACQEILKREPDNTGAQAYMLGLRLVLDDNESALLKLDDLVRLHPEHMPTACRFALRYLNGQERKEEARVYQFRLDEWSYQSRAAEEERRMIYASDIFLPHNVTHEYIRKLAGILKKHPEIGSAWMARKQVHYLKENPLFVVGLKPSFWSLKSRKATIKQIKRALEQAHFPPYFQFFWMGEVKGLETRLKKTGAAALYKK
jgi:Zn-dependent protease with chaperone function